MLYNQYIFASKNGLKCYLIMLVEKKVKYIYFRQIWHRRTQKSQNSKSKDNLDKDNLVITNYKYSLQDYYKYAALCHLQIVIMNISSKY